eukprot:6419579-Prorocentrum_lima.AAC.1
MPRSAANEALLFLLRGHVMDILQPAKGQKTAVHRLAMACCRVALRRCTEEVQEALSTQRPSWLNEEFIDAVTNPEKVQEKPVSIQASSNLGGKTQDIKSSRLVQGGEKASLESGSTEVQGWKQE